MKVKGISVTGLSKRQVAAMRRHARHHTAKHLRSMVAYTKPTLRKRLFYRIKAGSKGGRAGQWSARHSEGAIISKSI